MANEAHYPILNLDAIENLKLDWRFKGLPTSAMGIRLADIGALHLNVLQEGLALPAALIKESALEHNRRWMRNFVSAEGVDICPHGKTTMAPQLFELQLQDGAWGITAATVSHVRTYRAHGIRRILLANQLVARHDIDYVLAEIDRDHDFDFFCLVDSTAGLECLANAVTARKPRRPLQLLIEVGLKGGRTGVRTLDQGMALARKIATQGPGLALRGIEAFEGIVHGKEHSDLETKVQILFSDMLTLAAQVESQGLFAHGDVILTAGGSAFFDLAARCLKQNTLARRAKVVLRSGCYLTHDSHHYRVYHERMRERCPIVAMHGTGLLAALEIVAYVQSIPEPGMAIAGFGKRDASYDIDLPTPLWRHRPGLHRRPECIQEQCEVTALNDQHAYVSARSPNMHFAVGDILGFGISHPCTTFDKWPLLFVVDDEYRVVSAIRTFF